MRKLIVMFGFVCAAPVHADSIAPPYTYKKFSNDGKFVFVMIPRTSLENELQFWNEETKKVIKSIREMYPKSGLCKNDGSKEPLWTVDWYEYSVQVSNDGVHIVVGGPWPRLEEHPR